VGAITLVIGGARSGKSALAVEMGRRHPGEVVFVATAEPFDDDMASRIERHRIDRPAWPTVEAAHDLAAAVADIDDEAMVIVDCITVWVANELHHGADVDVAPLVAVLSSRHGPSVVVTNEVGLGVHPETELGRHYRDELGRVNQTLAEAASTTLLMVAGRAMRLGDPWKELQ
jgi:adenosylcobinamide kinase / adenosylcobinamide-phosphate guanylyltransferase